MDFFLSICVIYVSFRFFVLSPNSQCSKDGKGSELRTFLNSLSAKERARVVNQPDKNGSTP
jgi:hypothetical protein